MSAWNDATLLCVARDVEEETIVGIAADLRRIANDPSYGLTHSKAILEMISDKLLLRPRAYAYELAPQTNKP